MELLGKFIAITGGSKGIGKTIAKLFASKGAQVHPSVSALLWYDRIVALCCSFFVLLVDFPKIGIMDGERKHRRARL